MLKASRLHDQIAEVKAEAVARLADRLWDQFMLRPVMAVEMEFYLSGSRIETYPKAILAMIDRALEQAGIAAHPSEEERGTLQFEVALKPQKNLLTLAENVQAVPQVLRAALEPEGITADFSAKPFAADFGSGLHWHLHLEDRKQQNMFWREGEAGQYSRELLWTLGGLLDTLPQALLLFAPNPTSYARFEQPKLNAPTTLSWGPNNRTVALRLPSKPLDAKHIEHRVAGMDADPWLCIAAILAGTLHGLTRKLYPGEAVYGDASDAQYECDPIPGYDEALRLFKQSHVLQDYLGKELCGNVMQRVVYPDAF